MRSVAALASVLLIAACTTAPPPSGNAAATSSVAPSSPAATEATSATPAASPPALAYREVDDIPITVLFSEAADGLMAERATCTNAGGFTISYPATWYTNEKIGNVAACSWFGPEPIEAVDPADIPAQVAIVVHVFEGGVGQIPEYPRTDGGEVLLDGVFFGRFEDTIPSQPPEFAYQYSAWLDADYLGEKLTGTTLSSAAGDYVVNRAVLDRMMATLQLESRTTFAPAPDAEADALFSDLDECTNPEDGYTVQFPDAWYTNTAIGNVPACSWFTPDYFEVTEDSAAPEGIWISLAEIGSTVGYIGTTQDYLSESVFVGGRVGRRVEYNPNPMGTPDYRAYHFVVPFGADGIVRTFVAATDNTTAGEYRLAKAVLDRIVASLRFTE